MSDDWDADDFVPPPPVVTKEAPKGQWDDEDQEEEAKEEVVKEVKPKVEKKKKKEEVVPAEQPLDDPVAEKLRQQRLVEESDYNNAKELFGTTSSSKEAKSLDDMLPKSEADFVQYAELLASKAVHFEKSYHYQALLKAFFRKATAGLSASDAKDVNAAMGVIANEKLKVEREAAAGKKKGALKKKPATVKLEKGPEDDFAAYNDDSRGQDEYDFM